MAAVVVLLYKSTALLWTPTHFAELQIFQRYEVKSPGVRA